MEGKETEKRDGHSRLAGDNFNKQGNSHSRLVLSSHKVSRSPHPPARILKFTQRPQQDPVHISSPDGLNNTLLSQSCILEMAPSAGTVGNTYIPNILEGTRSLQLPRSSLSVNQWSCLLNYLLPRIVTDPQPVGCFLPRMPSIFVTTDCIISFSAEGHDRQFTMKIQHLICSFKKLCVWGWMYLCHDVGTVMSETQKQRQVRMECIFTKALCLIIGMQGGVCVYITYIYPIHIGENLYQ